MSLINCEDLIENTKVKSYKPDLESNGNRSDTFLTEEFYRNSSEHLQEEFVRIGALIRLFLEKTRSEEGKNRQDFPSMFISEIEANSIIQAVCYGSKAYNM
jgi:hypothetical protein